MEVYKYVVWVERNDYYFNTYKEAQAHYEEYLSKGYDDVELIKLKEEVNEGYKKGTLLQEYFLNPHFKPTEEEQKELEEFFTEIGGKEWKLN